MTWVLVLHALIGWCAVGLLIVLACLMVDGWANGFGRRWRAEILGAGAHWTWMTFVLSLLWPWFVAEFLADVVNGKLRR